MIKQSITIKLTALILIISVTPLLILASYSYLEKTHAETTRVKDTLTHVIEAGIDTVTDEITDVKKSSEAIAKIPEFTTHAHTLTQNTDPAQRANAERETSEYMAAALHANTLFREAYLRSLDGTLLLSSTAIPFTETLRADTSFHRALLGQTSMSDIILGKEPVRNEQGEFKIGHPLIFVSTPITHKGNTTAILTFRVDVISLFPAPTRYLAHTKTGEQYSLNSDGYFISHNRFPTPADELDPTKRHPQLKLHAHDPQTGTTNPLFLAAKHNETTINLKGYRDYRGVPVIGAARKIPGTDWTYIAKIDRAEAYESINQLQKFLIIELILSVTLIAIISRFTGRYATQPFTLLTRAAEALKRGKFGIRTRIRTNDEFEELSHAFNNAAKELGKTEAQRRQIDKAKTQFLSITSHELRSPMTPIRAQLQLLTQGTFGKLNPKQRASAQNILRNADRLDNILKDFLDISRIEAGRLKLDIKKTDLRKLILDATRLNDGQLPEKNIKITTNLPKLPIIHTDPDRITQVIINLLTNAFKFSRPNTTINITAQNLPNHVLISVKDQGIGIAPKDQQKLFRPFSQVEQELARKHGGTGLGLAICKGILSALGGRIWLESKTGKGTAVYFTVPKKTPAQKEVYSIFTISEDSPLERTFADILGQRGLTEFAKLQKEGLLDQTTLLRYTQESQKNGTITRAQAKELRKKINERQR